METQPQRKQIRSLLLAILLAGVCAAFLFACAPTTQEQEETFTASQQVVKDAGLTVLTADDGDIPARYSLYDNDFTLGVPVYAFTNSSGGTEYRIYGEKNERNRGFYEIEIEGNTVTAVSSMPIALTEETFGVCKGVAFSDKVNGYTADMARKGVFQAIDASTQPQIIIYGNFGGDSEAQFYPADAEKKMIPGALPIPIENLLQQNEEERDMISDINAQIQGYADGQQGW